MDFANENYVRLYTRDTTTWRRLGWDGQCLLLHLLRRVDRAGVIEIDDMQPVEAASMHTGAPVDCARDGMARLLELGVVEHRGDRLVLPRFIEAQEASKSDKQRQRESRERRRDQSRSEPSRNVTPRHAESQPVTAGHDESQAVTLCSAVPCNADPMQRSAVPPEPERPAAPDRQISAAAAGVRFVASLFGRDAFSVPPLGAYVQEYGWIGTRPEAERAAVRLAIEADPWCQANKHVVDARHLTKRWQRYLAGPTKPVVGADDPTPRERLEAAKSRASAAQKVVNQLESAPFFDREHEDGRPKPGYMRSLEAAKAERSAAYAALRELQTPELRAVAS